MKSLIAAAVFFGLTTGAQAHFEIGKYNGIYGDGKNAGAACTFEILKVDFKNNLHHPLNEMVSIRLDFLGRAEAEIFSHLALVDVEKGRVRPKPEVLSSVTANPTGAEAVEMFMGEHGPERIVQVVDHYKTPAENSSVVCKDLVFQGK